MGKGLHRDTVAVEVLAPAKVNLSLEVLGRRADGYHELMTVFQAIDLCDVLTIEESDTLSLTVEGDAPASEENLVLRATRALWARSPGRGARLHLQKEIPAGAGLGGGSSDAAAALVGLNRLWAAGLGQEELVGIGRELGADVPFFLYGGAALGAGRGDVIEPLPPARGVWFVLSTPPFALPGKTGRIFSQMRVDEYTDGSRTLAVAESLRRGRLSQADLYNGLHAAARREFVDLLGYVAGLRRASHRDWTLSGAGPTFYSIATSSSEADHVAASVASLPGRRFVALPVTAADQL